MHVLAVVAGLSALALGLLAAGLFALVSLISQSAADALSVTTIGLSMAALGLSVGGALAWTGYQGLQGHPSRPFRPGLGWFWGCLAGLGLSLLIGQLIVSLGLLAPVTFPPFHVLGLSLPPVALLLLAGQALKHSPSAPTQRQVIGQVAVGALLAPAMAFTLEAAVAVIGLASIAVAMALAPGGLAELAELQALMADPALMSDPQTVTRWLLKPGILLPVILMLVVIAPLVEEAVKSVGVPLLARLSHTAPSLAQGWLWGMSVGVGFAITEGLFNGAANLPFWAGIAVLRAGAAGMHTVTAGLTGLGWAQTLASRRPLPVLGGYLASLALHSLWNGLTVLLVVASVWLMAEPDNPVKLAVGSLGILAGLIGLVLLTTTIVGVGAYITAWVRER